MSGPRQRVLPRTGSLRALERDLPQPPGAGGNGEFRVWGSGFRDLGFRVQGLHPRWLVCCRWDVLGSGLRGLGFQTQGSGFKL